MMLYLVTLGLLLALLAPAPPAAAARLEEKLHEQQAQARRVELELAAKREALQRVDRKEKNAAEELRSLERDLAVRQRHLARLENKVRACEASYQQAQDELALLMPEVGELRESLGQGLVVLASVEPHSDPAAIFGPEHPSRAAEMALYLERLAQAEARVIDSRLSDAERLRQSQEKLETEHERLLGLKAQVAREQAAVERRQAQKARLLASLGQQKRTYRQAARQLEASSRSIKQLIDELQDRIAAAEREAARRPGRPGPPPLPSTNFADCKGKLKMPVAGQIISGFGQRDDLGIASTGIDIEAAGGTPIDCVWRGRIAYAGMLKGYGMLVIVDHGDGYYTLYGRAAQLTKQAGEPVEKGEVLGTVADGAQGLYFEIRHHRTPQNPVAWLAGAVAANTRLR